MKSIKRAILGVLCCVFISFVFAITISANGQNDDEPASYIWIGNIKLENGKEIEASGYMKYPSNYREIINGIFEIVGKAYNEQN